METLVANLAGLIRHETRDGREYIVAPVTMIVPGVLNGSKGPLLYTIEDVRESAKTWDGMPLTLSHPFAVNGVFPSARSPEVQEKQGLGVLLNSRFSGGKLSAEAYFDVKRLAAIGDRVLERLKKGEKIEVSTGLGTQNEETSGTHNGVPYSAIARNYKPDHVAILLDAPGACSANDGCGVFNSNTLKSGMTSASEGHQHAVRIRNEGFGITGFADGHVHLIDEFKVREEDGHTHTIDKENLIDTAIKNTSTKGESKMEKKQRKETIDSLVENSCCWDAEGRDTLEALGDEHLEKLKEHADLSATRELSLNAATAEFTDEAGSIHTWNAEKKAWETKPKEQEKVTTVTNETKPQTIEDWKATAPPGVQEILHNAEVIQQREKDGLITKLVANVADSDKAGQVQRLQNRSLSDLQADVALMPAVKEEPGRTVDYSGAAGASPSAGVVNAENLPRFGLPEDYLAGELAASAN